jgi:hypothetical protein
MGNSRVKPGTKKKRPTRRKPNADRTEVAVPLPRPSPKAPPADREPSPDELRALEVAVDIAETRERLLGLARDYPRADRPLVGPLTEALKAVPGVKPVPARLVAQSLKKLADHGHDLDEIIGRILSGKHAPGEVGELVMACQRVTDELCSCADVLEDKLFDVFDRAKGLK